jgi:hypothetical protein
MFAGLMSRCTMPLEWAASSASAIWMATSSRISLSSGRPMMRMDGATLKQELHGDEGLALVLPDLVNSADIGMVQTRGTRFAAKTLEGARILGKLTWQKL